MARNLASAKHACYNVELSLGLEQSSGDFTIMSNPLLDIQKHGQSAWLDYIHRQDLENGDLQRRIDEEGVLGVTSESLDFPEGDRRFRYL